MRFGDIFVKKHTGKPVDYPGQVTPIGVYRCEHVFDILKADEHARPEIQHFQVKYKFTHAKTKEQVEVQSLMICDGCRTMMIGGVYPKVLGPTLMYFCEVDHEVKPDNDPNKA